MKTIEVKKGEIIQRRGELNSKIYAVEKGLLRTYFIDEKGREHVFMFAPEGWIVTDASAVNGPCELFIEALEDSTLCTLNAESEIANANQYAASGVNTLIDGVRGGGDFRTGDWQGYYGKNLHAVVSFDEARELSSIGISCIRAVSYTHLTLPTICSV